MNMELIPWIALAGLCGAVLSAWTFWWLVRVRMRESALHIQRLNEAHTQLLVQKQEQQKRIDEFGLQLRVVSDNLDQERAKRHQAELKVAELLTRLENLRSQAQSQMLEQQKNRQHLLDAFKSLSSDVLDASSRRFLEMANQRFDQLKQSNQADLDLRQQHIEDLVKPLTLSLQKTQDHVRELEKSRADAYGRIAEVVGMLQRETAQLSQALRTPRVRGRWGEIQLRRVVELAGMTAYCDFSEQVQSEQEDRLQRPDLIVQLPESRQLVVDAKVPLGAYLEAVEAESPSQRKACLKQHAGQFMTHIRQLASKQYWNDFEQAPEFVILFVPGDHFLSAALEERTDLIELAANQKVLLATPTTLIALLKAVAFGWNQQQMAENAKYVVGLAKDLHDRLLIFAGHMEATGKGLGNAVKSYNQAVRSFQNRLLVSARRFDELGVHSNKQIPQLSALPIPLQGPMNPLVEGESDASAKPHPSKD